MDDARTAWWLHTAVTRDKAERARAALGARGVDLDDPAEQVTAEEWLDAHRVEQLAEDPHRDITEADVVSDRRHDAGAGLAPAETAVADLRDRSTTDVTEHTDADRGHVLTAAEAAALVARGQTALAEIDARRQAEEQRKAEEAAEQERGEERARWASEAEPAEQADVDDAADW